MPNPSVSISAYPFMGQVTNLARAIINDAFTSRTGVVGGGRILTDNSAMMVPYLNSAMLELQDRLINNGIQTFKVDNVDLTPLTAVIQPDPSVQVSLSYTGYFNGTTTTATPALPATLLVPQKLWSRTTGSNLPFKEMTQPQEGLPSQSQGMSLSMWEWRGDSIWMNGALQSQDIRIRFIQRLPQFTGTENFNTTTIPIAGSTNALAYMVASKYALSRGATDVTALDAAAERAIRLMIQREVRQRQGVAYQRQGYGQGNSIYKRT